MPAVVRRAVRGMPCLAFVLAAALVGHPGGSAVLAQESPGSAAVFTTAAVELREWPGYDAPVLATLAGGEAAEVVGAVTVAADGSAWVPVLAAGQNGFLPAWVVSGAGPAAPAPAGPDAAAGADEAAPPAANPATDSPAAPSAGSLASAAETVEAVVPAATAGAVVATTSDVNLRSGPNADADVLRVLLPGTTVSVDGAAVDGFVPVTVDGASGWVAAEFLGGATVVPDAAATDEPATLAVTPVPPTPPVEPSPPAAAPAEREQAGTGIVWPFAGGTWQVIQGYNGGTHQNRSAFAQYYYALDWARVDGETAGQPVYAPVSGTIEWVDGGSGGLLMNAGNGYGVALFHITVDGGVTRGGSVERGQKIGVVSGPGGPGYASTPHVDMTLWELSGGGHVATPFTGPNAIAGQEFPDIGGANQHMGARVTP